MLKFSRVYPKVNRKIIIISSDLLRNYIDNYQRLQLAFTSSSALGLFARPILLRNRRHMWLQPVKITLRIPYIAMSRDFDEFTQPIEQSADSRTGHDR